MSPKIFDPQYGEMLGVSETSRLTGFSAHTLRSWRRPENAHLMRFPHYTNPASQTVWYRLADVQGWLDANGIHIEQSTLIPAEINNAANVFSAPVVPIQMDENKRLWLTELSKITTETMEKDGDHDKGFYGKVQAVVEDFSNKRRAVMPGLFRTYFDLPDDEPVTYAFYNHKTTHPDEWYVGGVLSLRRLFADHKGWDVSDAEICAIPIGLYVPYRNRNN